MPKEVKEKLPEEVNKEINRVAPKHVEAELANWLRANDGEAFLKNIRAAQSEVESRKERARLDGNEIQRLLQEVQNAEVGKEGCRTIGGLQLCWGRKDLEAPSDVNQKHTRAFGFQFASGFLGKPVVADSIKADVPGGDFAFAIYDHDLTEAAFSGYIVEIRKRPSDAPVEFSYIAIGRPISATSTTRSN